MQLSFLILILSILLLFSAFFSASEAALIALNKIRVRHMVENKKRGASRIYGLIQQMDKVIATVLVGNNIVNTVIASITTLVCTHIFGDGKGLIVGAFLASIVLIIFCELTPKIIATNHPEGVAFLFRHLVSFFIKVFRPITHLLTAISNGLIKFFGGNPHHRSPLVTEEEIKIMIQIGKEEGFYGDNERKMLERIFHFDEIEVRDVMTPLSRVTAVPIDIGQDELENALLEEGHNRIPVFKNSKDNVVGIIYVRDLLYLFKNNSLIKLEDLLSVPYFVSEKHKASELLKEFQKRKIQIGIVQNAQQKAVGIVTLEDLIEEIVGEIDEIDTRAKRE